MAGTKGTSPYSLLNFVALVVIASMRDMTVEGSTGPEDICGFADEAAVPALEVVITDLTTRTYGTKLLSEEILNFIKSGFPTLFTTDRLNDLQDIHFIEPINANTTEAEAQNATIDTASVFLSHWSLLYKHLTHLHYVCTNGEIGESVNDGSTTGTLREKLDELKSRTYSIVCDLKIGLNVLNTETSTPEYVISRDFLHDNFENSFTGEIYRTYIVTRESDMIMAHLNVIYSRIDEAINTNTP